VNRIKLENEVNNLRDEVERLKREYHYPAAPTWSVPSYQWPTYQWPLYQWPLYQWPRSPSVVYPHQFSHSPGYNGSMQCITLGGAQ